MENGNQAILDNQFEDNKGLTKREYFAAMAMQGLVDRHINYEVVAEHAVRYSDALLAELERTKSRIR
jgi:hypothetical protein